MQYATDEMMATKNTLWIHAKKSHDKCSHQKYIVDLQPDNDHTHDQVQMWIYVAIYMNQNYKTPIAT